MDEDDKFEYFYRKRLKEIETESIKDAKESFEVKKVKPEVGEAKMVVNPAMAAEKSTNIMIENNHVKEKNVADFLTNAPVSNIKTSIDDKVEKDVLIESFEDDDSSYSDECDSDESSVERDFGDDDPELGGGKDEYMFHTVNLVYVNYFEGLVEKLG